MLTVAQKIEALKMLADGISVNKIAQKYDCSEHSLFRWKKAYDGTLESLTNKSHKPYTQHPNSHTEEEIQQIERILSEYPNLGIKKLYSKLLEYGYSRTEAGLYRFLQKNNYIDAVRMKPNYEKVVAQIELLLSRILPKEKAKSIMKNIKKEID